MVPRLAPQCCPLPPANPVPPRQRRPSRPLSRPLPVLSFPFHGQSLSYPDLPERAPRCPSFDTLRSPEFQQHSLRLPHSDKFRMRLYFYLPSLFSFFRVFSSSPLVFWATCASSSQFR